jgi:hypothetical protein
VVAVGSVFEVLEQSVESCEAASVGRQLDAHRQDDQCRGTVRRHVVHITAQLSQQSLPLGGVALVLAGRMGDGGKSGCRDVVVRLNLSGGLLRTNIQYEQVSYLHLALVEWPRARRS